jgi:hypothetical protein
LDPQKISGAPEQAEFSDELGPRANGEARGPMDMGERFVGGGSADGGGRIRGQRVVTRLRRGPT